MNALVLDRDELDEALSKILFVEAGEVVSSVEMDFVNKKIEIKVNLDGAEVAESPSYISEVFTLSKFKVETNIFLGGSCYYTLAELSGIVSGIKSYIRKKSAEAIAQE